MNHAKAIVWSKMKVESISIFGFWLSVEKLRISLLFKFYNEMKPHCQNNVDATNWASKTTDDCLRVLETSD